MSKPFVTLKPSEQAILNAAATIYAGYVAGGKVPDGAEKDWLRRSLKEAIALAQLTDESVMADGEFD
ncbi:hypothetical protein [Thalassoroseus pseudoceratinae]|uniref:hypothetical protein n=1 Tax=Thalassoroseus pseudoceratinae TaxID=2713176 RepID=UPI00141E1D52|nr:hypothetical protein [Thalassoroseus pseudoceratinae]